MNIKINDKVQILALDSYYYECTGRIDCFLPDHNGRKVVGVRVNHSHGSGKYRAICKDKYCLVMSYYLKDLKKYKNKKDL